MKDMLIKRSYKEEDTMTFLGKVVVITGSGQGIGQCMALAYAKEGASVVVAELDEEAGLETKQLVESLGGECLFIPTDVANEQSVIHMVNLAVERYGKIDILVNNAAIKSGGDHDNLLTRSVQTFEKVMSVNVTGAYICAKYCVSVMPEGSSILNIASTRALMSEAHTEPYSASKGALLALTHSLANSLAHRVRVNAISPGWIDTSDWKKKKNRKFVALRSEDHVQHLVGRVGVPEDIVKAALYLTSDDASFMTGANMVIDGGMTVKMIYTE